MKRGAVVIAKAGKEKGGAYVVVGHFDERTVLIADGRRRTIEKPKKKNVAHLQRTNSVIDEISTNRQLHAFLSSWQQGG
jgi:ribosomal protein L14E/L6E/L27E